MNPSPIEDAALQQMRMECRHRNHRPKSKTPAECEAKLNREWQETTQALFTAKSSEDFGTMAVLYFQIANKFYDLGRPDFRDFLTRSSLANLNSHRGLGVAKVKLRTESCCDECAAYGGASIGLEEAISQSLVPIASCTNDIKPIGVGRCVCEYLPVFD